MAEALRYFPLFSHMLRTIDSFFTTGSRSDPRMFEATGRRDTRTNALRGGGSAIRPVAADSRFSWEVIRDTEDSERERQWKERQAAHALAWEGMRERPRSRPMLSWRPDTQK